MKRKASKVVMLGVIVAANIFVAINVGAYTNKEVFTAYTASSTGEQDSIQQLRERPIGKEHIGLKMKRLQLSEVLVELGLGADAWQKATAEGKSLVEYAHTKGVARQTIVQKMSDRIHEKVEQEVRVRKLPASKRDRLKKMLELRIERLIDRKLNEKELLRIS
ncbi:hypothetical protein NQ117_22715 [Paenibacillus sp. SC116]|uniref:hypothetical protein n=1 Tax=Paenibacillus sp. SC116 TaxID=2968986 RepID=UPI00215B2D4A|nr:hypothetical protein [Paenibacillus sp. SC116]MCR8846502.1 hypothetical protein [Paenibacillus sp. SC116]